MKSQECYNGLLADKLIDELSKRNLDGFYCETREDALNKLLEMIPKKSIVSFGGSSTLREMGVQSALKAADYNLLSPDDVQSATEKDRVAHQALGADYYLMSTNAISMTGELVNIDGYGNRVASLIFGPKHVIVIAGLNKVTPDLKSAIQRAKCYAAPMTMLIFKQDYACFDELCKDAEEACRHIVVTSSSVVKGRIKVILVGESLGF